MSVICLSWEAAHHSPDFIHSLQRNCNCKLIMISFQLFEWETLKIVWRTTSYGHLMEASFHSFTLHWWSCSQLMSRKEQAVEQTAVSFVKGHPDLPSEGLFCVRETCLTAPVRAGGGCSVRRTYSLNSGRFHQWAHIWNLVVFLNIFVHLWWKYIYIFSINPRLPRM